MLFSTPQLGVTPANSTLRHWGDFWIVPTLSSFFHPHTSFYFPIFKLLGSLGKRGNHPLVHLHSLCFLTSVTLILSSFLLLFLLFYFFSRFISPLVYPLLPHSRVSLPPVSQAQQEVRSWWKWSREEGREREHVNKQKIPEVMDGNSRERACLMCPLKASVNHSVYQSHWEVKDDL